MLLSVLNPRLQSLSPDAAVGLGTLGVCLGLVEFNRPGRVLPGAVGLLLLLLASASLAAMPGGQPGTALRPVSVLSLMAAGATLARNAWRPIPWPILIGASLILVASLRWLLRSTCPHPIHADVAVPCGLLVAALSIFLTRIAFRARRAKALD
jgi:membrane-bound serine protease (ClpP class)